MLVNYLLFHTFTHLWHLSLLYVCKSIQFSLIGSAVGQAFITDVSLGSWVDVPAHQCCLGRRAGILLSILMAHTHNTTQRWAALDSNKVCCFIFAQNTNIMELFSCIIASNEQLKYYNSETGTFVQPLWQSGGYSKWVLKNNIDLMVWYDNDVGEN